MYGITKYIEDRCEVTGKIAWHILWHTGPYKIASENYNHILPVTEDDLILVKDVDDNHEENDQTYVTTYFEKKKLTENGSQSHTYSTVSSVDKQLIVTELSTMTIYRMSLSTV